MMGRTHLATAVAVWSASSAAITGNPHLEAIPVVAFASILPDIDHPGSKLGRRLAHLLIPTMIVYACVWYIKPVLFREYPVYFAIPPVTFGIPIILYYTVGHRTLTHSAFACVAMAALALFGYISQSVFAILAYAIAFGYLMHILCDWITDEGIVFLWPFTQHRFNSPIGFKTNGFVEALVLISALCGIGIVLWNSRGVIFPA